MFLLYVDATQFVQLARPVPCHSFEAVSRGAASCSSSVLEYSDLSAADHMAALLKLCTSVLPIARSHDHLAASCDFASLIEACRLSTTLARGLRAHGHSGQPTEGFCQKQCATSQEVYQA